MSASNRLRVRMAAAWVCLLAALGLYAPLAAATLVAHGMACCSGDHCPIAKHHHPKKQTAPRPEMDCGHDTGAMMTNCSMSCCEDSEKPLVTAVMFVMPESNQGLASASVVGSAEVVWTVEIARAEKPLSPPPRVAETQ